MGCSASASNSKQVYSPDSLTIVAESGKIFLLGCGRDMLIADVKSAMEMRIGAKAESFKLVIRPMISSEQATKSSPSDSPPNAQPNNISNNNNNAIPLQSGFCIENNAEIADSATEEIELQDDQLLSFYEKYLGKHKKIFLVQNNSHKQFFTEYQTREKVKAVQPQQYHQQHLQHQQFSQSSSMVMEQPQLGINQSIHLGVYKSEQRIVEIIDRLENGEYISHSQIDKIQISQMQQKQNYQSEYPQNQLAMLNQSNINVSPMKEFQPLNNVSLISSSNLQLKNQDD